MNKTQYLDIEQRVIQLLITRSALLNDSRLRAEHFFSERNARIFDAIESIADRGEAVDAYAVTIELEKNHGDSDLNYVVDLFESPYVSAENFAKYSRMIEQAWVLRKAIDIATTLQNDIQADGDQQHIDSAIQNLMTLNDTEQTYDKHIKVGIKAALERLDRLFNGKEDVGIATGINALDRAIGGWQPERLYVLAGRPGKGKSALALNLANNLALANAPVQFFSLEMGGEELANRLISINSSINSHKINTGQLDETEFTRLGQGVLRLQDQPFYTNDQQDITIQGIARAARRAKKNHDIKVLIVDYIQNVGTSVRCQTMQEQVKQVTWGLKCLARELKISVIGLAQLNREADKLVDRPAGMQHIADASGIEKDADFVGTLFATEEMERDGRLIVHACKNRNGPKGDISLSYERQYFRIGDGRI